MLALGLLASACGRSEQEAAEQFRAARAVMTKNLVDPASAQFRDERVRTLWSRTGSRLRVYCAEVRVKDVSGEYGEFEAAEAILAASLTHPQMMGYHKAGAVFLPANAQKFYLDCERPDTARTDAGLEAAFPPGDRELSAERRAAVDRAYPVLSNDPAPPQGAAPAAVRGHRH